MGKNKEALKKLGKGIARVTILPKTITYRNTIWDKLELKWWGIPTTISYYKPSLPCLANNYKSDDLIIILGKCIYFSEAKNSQGLETFLVKTFSEKEAKRLEPKIKMWSLIELGRSIKVYFWPPDAKG